MNFKKQKLSNHLLCEEMEKKITAYLKSPEWAERQEQLRIKRIHDFEEAKKIVFTI